jgi:hypothetical protein
MGRTYVHQPPGLGVDSIPATAAAAKNQAVRIAVLDHRQLKIPVGGRCGDGLPGAFVHGRLFRAIFNN